MLCRCDNIGLVSLILTGCELRILYHCTMTLLCTRHPDLVSIDFCAIPIFHILLLLVIVCIRYCVKFSNCLERSEGSHISPCRSIITS